MTEEKWVVEIEGTKYHIWATDVSDAIEQAIALGAIKVYKFHENEIQNEPITRTYPSCIDQEVIDALTDTELHDALVRINDELNNRRSGTISIPDYSNILRMG